LFSVVVFEEALLGLVEPVEELEDLFVQLGEVGVLSDLCDGVGQGGKGLLLQGVLCVQDLLGADGLVEVPPLDLAHKEFEVRVFFQELHL